MKNLMLFVHPSKDFLEEQRTSIKIEIDNSLSLGWKVEDIILATNFPYEYNGVRSLLVSNDNYCGDISPCASIINVIVELFERKLIEKGELYWYHDTDAYQLYDITESEIDLGEADIGLVEMGNRQKISASSIFFKSSAEDFFERAKEIMYKYRINEELALNTLSSNNLLWATGSQSDAKTKFVPLNLPGAENAHKRVKKLNVTYDLEWDSLGQHYQLAVKPIKVAHFHFSSDISLDSFMYGKNSLKMILAPKRLIKIFEKHGVKGTFPKKMKNLMIYLNPEKKFLGETEGLVKRQIDNSLKLGWKKEDIMLLTNFPYEYQDIKSTALDDSLFRDIKDKAYNSHAILHLLTQRIVREAELWWFHDLDVFQLKPMDSSQIDLEEATAGFMDDGYSNKFDTGSFFFRKESNKIFEWMRNRVCSLNTDEATALTSLAAANFHNINSKYKKLNNIFTTKQKSKL
jgi:hypothetical protein